MFDISATELLIIAAVALVVIGPKDLPDMLRGLGRFVRKLRMMAGDFQRQLDQAGFEDVRKGFEEVRSLTSPSGVIARSVASSLEVDETKSTLEQKAVSPASSTPEGTSTPEDGKAVPSDGVDTTVVRVSTANEANALGAETVVASSAAPASSAEPSPSAPPEDSRPATKAETVAGRGDS
ncbi:Sec-independent protein translocase protein TatB [Rhodoligotrophos defluvii]|uniref:Sec-independent protein translocase protein TatB n=1 Tax=Rhodoligotrophos defluvii TaxID=2561934 RepID=UPI0010C9C403|nr:Sec-independent protein translocase protein TatB [Rhodoligotrophos defluvii]